MTRVEDAPLLRGQGRFVDDLDIPGALHVAFLRSPVAHGRLKGIDASAAKALPGVHAVLTYRRSAAAADRATASRRRCRPARSASTSIPTCCQGRGHLRRRAGRDGGGREPPHRRGRAGADRARSRGAAGGDRSGRGARARRAQGADWIARTISSRGRASTTATSTARSPRPRIASSSAFACTRAAAIRSRRAASRCGSIRSTTG